MYRRCLFVVGVVATAVATSNCQRSLPEMQELQLDLTPSESVPLAAQVTFRTDRPTTVELEIDDGQQSWTVATRVASSDSHVVPILGLRPDRTHMVRVMVIDDRGRRFTSGILEVETDPLPEDFPPIDVRISNPTRMEPGVTMFEPTYRSMDNEEVDDHFLVAIDAVGEVVWYYRAEHPVSDARRLQNGNLLYRTGRAGPLYEIDMLGNRVSEWHTNRTPDDQVAPDSIYVDTDTLHHETFETRSGNIVAISTELRTYDNYPTSDSLVDAPSAVSEVLGDVIIEFNPQGEVLREMLLLDFLDPYRIGYNSLDWGGGWRVLFPQEEETYPRRDWAHANAVILDASERYAIVSLRHQDAVVKIDWHNEELVWILGNHNGWAPQWQDYLLQPKGELLWPYHQHAPMITPTGTILLFDNGNYRASPFEEPMPPSESFSRAVEYQIDEETMEVSEVWSYGKPGDESFFARFLGDADWMPLTGNVLINYGGLVSDETGQPIVDGPGHNWVRILEVTRDDPSEEVFELVIDDEPPRGWSVYRAERLPSLYP